MSVASANPFNLLEQQEEEEDQSQTMSAPLKDIVRTGTSSKKTDQAPGEEREARPRGGRGGRGAGRGGRGRGRREGNETAFRDREAGTDKNHEKSTGDEDGGERPPRGARGGGARGGRGRGRVFDRHSQTGRIDTGKQVNQGWGAPENEWGDETAATAIAQADQTEAAAPDEAPASRNDNQGGGGGEDPAARAEPAPEAEPEENTKSLDEYLAEQAEKLSSLGSLPEARKPNEGNADRWGDAQAIERGDNTSYFGGKPREGPHRQRTRKEKQVVEITPLPTPRPQRDGRGGRGGGRGGRGRGRGRGRGDHGDGGGYGNADSYRGDSGYGNGNRGDRAAPAKPKQQAISLDDFPSL